MKKLIFLPFLVFLLSILHLNAQFQLVAPIRISNDTETFDSPETVIPADLDADGDIDLITRSIFHGNLVWYENLDGNGSMDDPKIIVDFGNFGIEFISVIDIDNDGLLDILGIHDEDVFWFKNTLQKTAIFSDAIYLPTSGLSFGREVKMGDINGDDILDIVWAGHSLSLFWLEGIDGNGNFHPSEELFPDGRYYIELADFDNDGDLDIVSPSYDNGDFSLVWFENLDGNANFNSSQPIDELIEAPEDLQVVDIDMDGDLDIMFGFWTSSSTPSNYNWYENKLNEDGTWLKKIIPDIDNIAVPTFYDIDTDGDLDFVTTQGGLRVYENEDGLGNFIPGDTLAIIGGSSLSHADMNNDGVEDIIGVYRTVTVNHELGLIYFGRADHTFENPIDYIGDADQFKTYSGGFMEGKDLNGDGVPELISSHHLIDRIGWQSFDNSHLKFTNPRILDDLRAADIDFADFDGDGDEDIVLAANETGNQQVVWYEKLNGENNYGRANVLFTEHQSLNQVHAVDLDGDGDMDIVSNKPGGDHPGIHWFENLNGNGDFSTFQNISPVHYSSIEIEDFDLDGDFDIFCYDESPGGFYWFENQNGVFSDPVLLLDVETVDAYLLEDLDGNGWKDLIYIDENNIVSVRKRNSGTGNYAAAINLTGINSSPDRNELFLRDFDLDGDKDLIVSKVNVNNPVLTFFENNGGQEIFLNGTPFYNLPENTARIAIDDFDGDGDDDMIIHDDGNLSLHFAENFQNKPKITGKTYFDMNENAFHDSNEPLIFPEAIHVEPAALASFPSGSGHFKFAVDSGNYDVTCQVYSGFSYTTPSTVSVEVTEDSNAEISYGINTESEYIRALIALTSGPTRCGFEVPFWIDYQNHGTITANAIISMDIDSLSEFISSVPVPDSIVGHRIYWSHDNLLPTHSGQIELIVKMPGVEHIGEYLTFNSIIDFTSTDGLHNIYTEAPLRPQINCAYDPNDKLVEPSIPGNENYTLFGDTLDYVVRFQNTGTDTAFTVVIEDFLDANLDYSTLKIMGASHPYEVILDEKTGRMVFVFDNILLPDSTTNEVKSHGYFRYRIQHLDDLPEYTYIQNYASIFFDFNPPIITNTVENILVSSYPLLVDVQHPSCFGDEDGSLNILFDLPFYDSIQWSTGDTSLLISNLSEGAYDLTIYFTDGSHLDTTFSIKEPSPIEILEPILEPVICYNGGSVEIMVSGGTPAYYFQWSNFVNTPNQYNLPPGIYQLTVTDIKSCKDSLEVMIDASTSSEISLTVDVTPEITQMMNGTISVQTTGGQPPYNYSWDFDSNETENTISNLSFGDYTVTVTDADGCTQVQTITVEQLTNSNDLQKQFHFQVSPNPNNGDFKAFLSIPNQESWKINIMNSIGQVVHTVESTALGSRNQQFDFSIAPGIYHIALWIEGRIVQTELIIAM